MEVMPKLGDRIRAAANEAPQPSDPLKVRYLSCVPEILRWQGMSSMTSGRHNDDNDLRRRIFAETLSDIDAHEQGHVLDGLSYAPVGAHLLDDLLLIFKYGFSPKALMAMTERNAQLTALAHAKEPRFILAAALSYVARDVELTQHARGYFDLVQSFVHYLNAHSKEFPEIDPRKRLLDQFPRLSPEQIHQLAPSVAQEEGLPQRAARVLKESRP
jgi:hypothetical protein